MGRSISQSALWKCTGSVIRIELQRLNYSECCLGDVTVKLEVLLSNSIQNSILITDPVSIPRGDTHFESVRLSGQWSITTNLPSGRNVSERENGTFSRLPFPGSRRRRRRQQRHESVRAGERPYQPTSSAPPPRPGKEDKLVVVQLILAHISW